MAFQTIERADPFGRIGKAFGEGLSDQIPKEMEHQRLSSGLQKLADLADQGKLSPAQFLAKASGTYGATPQIVQSFGDLARQQAYNNAQSKEMAETQYKPNVNTKVAGAEGEQSKGATQSITTTAPVEATTKPPIPPTFEERHNNAVKNFNADRAKYNNDFQNAMGEQNQIVQAQQERNVALQNQRKGEQDVQKTVRGELQEIAKRANVEIPDDIYNGIENKALDDVKSGKKSELEAAKDAREEMNEISKQYQSLKTVGSTDHILKSAAATKTTLKNIREGFKKRGDLENLALGYIKDNNLSPGKAYYLAFDPSEDKELNNALFKLPEMKPPITYKRGFVEKDPDFIKQKTMEAAPELAKALGKEGSPLAVGEVLNSLGYDREAWIEYLSNNRKKLDLSERQGRELSTPLNTFPTLNDNFLFWTSGLEKLVEK